MKPIQIISTAFTILIFSCTSGSKKHTKTETLNNTAHSSPDTIASQQIPDSIKRLVADDYPITNEMLALQNTANSSSFKKLSGRTQSLDKAWFGNDSLKQTLVVELYTDYHRMAVYHFYNRRIPKELLNKIELHTKDGELATQAQKLTDLPGFVKQAAQISAAYFKTTKGFNLGDDKQKAIDLYGFPDKRTLKDSIEIMEWNFAGDQVYNGKDSLMGRPLVRDSYGHQVTMFFIKGKLTALMLYNEIP